MLTELCDELNNYFCEYKDIKNGIYSIVGGKLTPPVDLPDGQYFRITGSVFNDGVYQYTEELQLKDEPAFDGAVWAMKVPKDFLDLAERIAEWRTKNESTDSPNMSPYQSESFGIYSYSKGASGDDSGGAAVSWKKQFKSDLDRYRKMWGMF